MAKKSGVNQSAAVRELLESNPDIGANEAIAALAKKGINVKKGLFYLVKGKMKGTSERKAHVIKAAKSATSSGQIDPISLIREVKALAVKAGGYDKLVDLAMALAE